MNNSSTSQKRTNIAMKSQNVIYNNNYGKVEKYFYFNLSSCCEYGKMFTVRTFERNRSWDRQDLTNVKMDQFVFMSRNNTDYKYKLTSLY